MKVAPSVALYIKLGERGRWEKNSIEEEQTLHLGYNEVPHELCVESRWDDVKEFLIRERASDRGAAKRHANQIKFFYEGGEDILWITFYDNRLWWCFSRPEVTQRSDGSKTRPVAGRWSSEDVAGEPLDMNRLSGKLLSVQGFQGTICSVRDLDYLLQKINAEPQPDVLAAQAAQASLVDAIERLIRSLHWRDFEVLIDLLFREAGWNRVGELGGPQKTLDITLEAPVTGERYGVQVKSKANLAGFNEYRQRLGKLEGFARFYFAVHSPANDLASVPPLKGKFELLRPAEISKLVVRYGLQDWVIQKAR